MIFWFGCQVFVLTDGQVSNTEAVISLVEKNNANTRVFSLGIGSSVSHHLVEGLARAGKGTSQFVTGGGPATQEKVGNPRKLFFCFVLFISVRILLCLKMYLIYSHDY